MEEADIQLRGHEDEDETDELMDRIREEADMQPRGGHPPTQSSLRRSVLSNAQATDAANSGHRTISFCSTDVIEYAHVAKLASRPAASSPMTPESELVQYAVPDDGPCLQEQRL